MGWVSTLILLVVLSLAPTVAFLLLWKFLSYLRDDALIHELRFKHDIEPTPQRGFSAVFGSNRSSSQLTLTTCPDCGAKTPAGHGSCLLCDSDSR